MLNEKEWFKISSMDKRIIKDVKVCCIDDGLKWHYEDDGIHPFTIWIYCLKNEFMKIVKTIGFNNNQVIKSVSRF